jgi:hypothetical protein
MSPERLGRSAPHRAFTMEPELTRFATAWTERL